MEALAKNNIKALPTWVLYLYLVFVFFNSFTKFSVPAFGKYEFTVSDLAILAVGGILLIFRSSIQKDFNKYLIIYIYFLFSVGISILSAISLTLYLSDFIPYIFAFFIVFSTVTIFSTFDSLKLLKQIRFLLLLALFLSSLPVYYQVFTGTKLGYFFDVWGWRYTFLAQNPNQYGVTLILYFIIISLVTLKYDNKNITKLLLFMIFFIPVALYTGSRTTSVIFALNLIFIAIITFARSNVATKMTVVPTFIFIIIISLPSALTFLKTNGGQINRALSIFTAIEEGGIDGVKVGGDSGKSIDEAIEIFLKNPIVGVGLANKPMHSDRGTEIHNTYLKTLAETGIIGFFGFALIFNLPLIAFMFSRTSNTNKLFFLLFYLLFAAMNWPYMLLRQRWVWFFMTMMYLIARIDKNGNPESSRLKILN